MKPTPTPVNASSPTATPTDPCQNKADEQKLSPEQKAKWLAALRSGKYVQGANYLGFKSTGYCCLGVFCIANNIRFNGSDSGENHGPVGLLSAVPVEARMELTKKNDNGWPFTKLADWIEKNL